jgi:hypothetical protein
VQCALVKKNDMSTSTGKTRLRLTLLSEIYWNSSADRRGTEVESSVLPVESSDSDAKLAVLDLESVAVSDHTTCAGCGLAFDTVTEQRSHFKSDLHKYNARRRAKGRIPVTIDEFDSLGHEESASIGSISASEDEMSSDSDVESEVSSSVLPSSGKLEFEDPTTEGQYIVVYKVALPDQVSLQSLAQRGSWAVFMSGGGHFAAGIWDASGKITHHKTFHRYTSRKKQGGSQAVADAAGGRLVLFTAMHRAVV